MNLNWLSFWGHLLSRELLQVLHDHHLWDRDSWPVSWGSGYVDGECLSKKCCLDLSQLGFDWTSLITYWQQWRFFALWLSSCHHHHRHPSGLSKEISVPMLDQTCANITASFSCLSFAVGKETFSSYKYSMICFPLKIHHLELPFFTEELQPNFCYDPNTVVRSWNPSRCSRVSMSLGLAPEESRVWRMAWAISGNFPSERRRKLQENVKKKQLHTVPSNYIGKCWLTCFDMLDAWHANIQYLLHKVFWLPIIQTLTRIQTTSWASILDR